MSAKSAFYFCAEFLFLIISCTMSHMSLALYRTYRPQRFEDLTGQNHVKITIQHELETGKIAHAYLFCGPRGVGKTTMARLLAKALNCLKRKKGESEPCNECSSCTEVLAGRDLDVLEVDAASHTGVDNVRDNIIQGARVSPSARKYKVFIIDEVHMLSTSAFNALLKLLEEPPVHAIFVLCTTESHKIPATIISRCQRFDFKKITTADLMKRLRWVCEQEGVRVSDDVLADIARHAEGGLRDAESLLGQILALGEKNITREQAELVLPHSHYNLVIDFLEHLFNRAAEPAVRLVNSLVDDGVDVEQFTIDSIEVARKILLMNINPAMRSLAAELDPSLEERLRTIASMVSTPHIIKAIDVLMEARRQSRSAVLPQMPLEIAIVSYACGDMNNEQQAPGATPRKITKPTPTHHQSSPVPSATPTPPPAVVMSKGDSSERASADTFKKEKKMTSTKRAKTSEASMTIETIRAQWHDFLVLLQESHASLTFILKVSEPLRIEDDALVIGFKYPFHQKRINEQKITHSIEEKISEFFESPLRILTELLPEGYVSQMIEQETRRDEVEFVNAVPEQVTVVQITEPESPAQKPRTASAQTDLLGSVKNTRDISTAHTDPAALVVQLVQSFGGKIVE